MEPFIGQIMMVGFNFAPRGWALCDGSLLPINNNQALFSLLGTTYGGDGRTTFQLPDLRGRVPMHQGTGPGLPNHRIGEKGGVENVTLTVAQMPAHTHVLNASSDYGSQKSPANGVPAKADDGEQNYAPAASANTNLSPTANNGSGLSHPNTLRLVSFKVKSI